MIIHDHLALLRNRISGNHRCHKKLLLHFRIAERMNFLLMCRLWIGSMRLWSYVVVNVVMMAIVEKFCSTFSTWGFYVYWPKFYILILLIWIWELFEFCSLSWCNILIIVFSFVSSWMLLNLGPVSVFFVAPYMVYVWCARRIISVHQFCKL